MKLLCYFLDHNRRFVGHTTEHIFGHLGYKAASYPRSILRYRCVRCGTREAVVIE